MRRIIGGEAVIDRASNPRFVHKALILIFSSAVCPKTEVFGRFFSMRYLKLHLYGRKRQDNKEFVSKRCDFNAFL